MTQKPPIRKKRSRFTRTNQTNGWMGRSDREGGKRERDRKGKGKERGRSEDEARTQGTQASSGPKDDLRVGKRHESGRDKRGKVIKDPSEGRPSKTEWGASVYADALGLLGHG